MNFKPLLNNILVEMEQEENKTKSGIVLPDSIEKKESTIGIVSAIGPGKTNENGTKLPLSVKIGDKILFPKPWEDDRKIESDGKKYYIIPEECILGIIE